MLYGTDPETENRVRHWCRGQGYGVCLVGFLRHVLLSGCAGAFGQLCGAGAHGSPVLRCLQRPLYGGSSGKDSHPMGAFPSMDLFRYAAQCAGTLRPVCRPCAGRSSADGLFQRGVHPVGRHLYHDGYPLLVHDPGRDPHPKRPGEPFHGGPYLCRRWLCPHRHVHHAAGGSPWRRQRARRLPLGGIDRSGNFCSDRAGVLHFHERNHPQ